MFSRTDTSMLGRWWWTVDRWILGAILILMVVGAILVATAGSPVARRIGLSEMHFFARHLMYLVVSLGLLVGVSMLERRHVLLAAMAALALSLMAMVLVLFVGVEVKGARRWLQVPFFSLQPSEFMKPAFFVVSAWLMAHAQVRGTWAGRAVPMLLMLLAVGLLVLQPDIGMTLVVCFVWAAQLFVAGMPLWLMLGVAGLGVAGLSSAYFIFPHVASRVDRFLDPASGDTYQVDNAQLALGEGGLLGVGLGQGRMKEMIPDVHADFIFAVAGEELGLIGALALLGLFLFIILRGWGRAGQSSSLFVAIAVSGLIAQFAVQAMINIGSTLHLLPTKGMTLPLVSYGGSSLVAMGFGLGMVLALLRKRPEEGVRL